MSDNVIRVENLAKKYIISHQQDSSTSYRYKALRDVIAHGVKSIGKKFIQALVKKSAIHPVKNFGH